MILRNEFFANYLQDFLLVGAVSCLLVPINSIYSTIFSVVWLLVQCLLCPPSFQRFLWPLAFILLFFSRTWLLNEMPHPASAEDAILLCSALILAGTFVAKRMQRLFLILPLSLPIAFVGISSKPWAPNPFVGANQGAYILGILALVCGCCLASGGLLSKWLKTFYAVLLAMSLVMIWHTGSRAALLGSVGAALFVLCLRSIQNKTVSKQFLPVLGVLVMAYLTKLFLPSTSGIPGLKTGSDAGRIFVAQCYSGLPFTGHNRLIYGLGFHRQGQFCQQLFEGKPFDHAHNIYLQAWANVGILGVVGIFILGFLLWRSWSRVPLNDSGNTLIVNIGISTSAYIFFLGFLDASLIHWPALLIISGLCLATPFVLHPVHTDIEAPKT
tara:strand:+ start:1306 stop:2457 length:1152 start_codon:yes stop_codon:yes gene_type:complete